MAIRVDIKVNHLNNLQHFIRQNCIFTTMICILFVFLILLNFFLKLFRINFRVLTLFSSEFSIFHLNFPHIHHFSQIIYIIFI